MNRVCIVSASGQNVFFDELLAALEGALARAGVTTERAVDHFPRLEDGLAYLFVPHEYMPLTMPEAHPGGAQLKRSVALCTEQPGTVWFEEAAAVAEKAGRAVDINREGTRALRIRGVAAETVQLGYVPEWDSWGGDESRPRPVDLTFMGGYTPRRAALLAACGRVLADRRASIHLFDMRRPHTEDSAAFLSGESKWRHLAASKVIINVHRSPLAYLEWQRVIGAMANGCVVISEHSVGVEPLAPGEHFVSASAENIPFVLQALLGNDERLASIRQNAYDTLRQQLPIDAGIHVLAEALESVSSASAGVESPGARQPLPRPRPPKEPPPEYVRLADERSEMDVVRMALKQLVLGQMGLRRELSTSTEAPAADRVERYGHTYRSRPRVSVVLTVFNYENLVGEAIASVAASDYDGYELVAVDDASTDGSLAATRAAVQAHPWMPSTVVARGQNGGLAAARNLGIRYAQGDYVFILDADNAIYPHCFSRLAGALDEDPEAAFAYGILEIFGTAGPKGLTSWLAWDPYQLRFGNFVDAMAMIRRSAVEAAGGYTSDRRLFGWEDFALWCALADRGMRGVGVPEIVARYRSSVQSMISLTDIDGSVTWTALTERYGVLTSSVPTRG